MGKRALKAVVVLAILLLAYGCAGPKKVRLYDSPTAAPVSDLRNNIVQTAISLHGNPYKNGAKGADAFDCSGFVHFVYKRSGITVPVSTDGLIKAGTEISRDQVQPGDLVFFKIKKDLHIGIMINRKEFIHASKSRGIALDDLDANYWRRTLQCFRCVLT